MTTKAMPLFTSIKRRTPTASTSRRSHEKNRTSSGRSANRYLKSILYGNRTPNRDADWNATDPAQLPASTWMFEVVFDYEDGHYQEQQPDANGRIFAQATIALPPNSSWPVRQDPFSSYRAGFEVRTYRLCRRVLMFHHFPDELGTADYLVRSTEFTYNQSPIASFITQVTQSGYVRQPDGNYLKKSLPPSRLNIARRLSAKKSRRRSQRVSRIFLLDLTARVTSGSI